MGWEDRKVEKKATRSYRLMVDLDRNMSILSSIEYFPRHI
jgi:hypothetical protein